MKILVFDIETAPITAYVWGLRDQNVALNQIKQDWSVMAWAAKWLGDPPSKVMYFDQRNAKDVYNDYKILQPLWKLLDETDIVITQNGQSFDGPRLNARFITHGMPPPSPYRHLDTYRIIKRVAEFTSNKLEYLTAKLCTKYKKITHGKFPGMSLWKECLAGNLDAWNEMKRYNIRDVLSTEEFYMKIRAWTPELMRSAHFVKKGAPDCSVCGSHHTYHQGVYVLKRGKYHKVHCRSCGAWRKGEKIKEAA